MGKTVRGFSKSIEKDQSVIWPLPQRVIRIHYSSSD
jgi:hypothetical protein